MAYAFLCDVAACACKLFLPVLTMASSERHVVHKKKGGGADDFFRVDFSFDTRDRVCRCVKKELTAPRTRNAVNFFS